MSGYLIQMFSMSLLLTLLLEFAVACLIDRPMNRKKAWLVVLVNVLTNPAAVWIVWVSGFFASGIAAWILEIIIELLVIVAEAGVYLTFSKEKTWNLKRPVLLAVAANTISWLTGVILQVLI